MVTLRIHIYIYVYMYMYISIFTNYDRASATKVSKCLESFKISPPGDFWLPFVCQDGLGMLRNADLQNYPILTSILKLSRLHLGPQYGTQNSSKIRCRSVPSRFFERLGLVYASGHIFQRFWTQKSCPGTSKFTKILKEK